MHRSIDDLTPAYAFNKLQYEFHHKVVENNKTHGNDCG